jgi:hypothetical protein
MDEKLLLLLQVTTLNYASISKIGYFQVFKSPKQRVKKIAVLTK